jgi:16S rRNA processing protein RimM
MGELLVYPYLNDLTYYERLPAVALHDQERFLMEKRVAQVRRAGERLLLQLEGLASIEAVEPLIGCEICVPRDDLPPPARGEFYWCDLEGLAVLTQEGESLGRVADFFPTGSNEVLVVRDGEREILLPFIKDVVLSVDEAQGYLHVRVLPGLL